MSLRKFVEFRDGRDTPKPFIDHIEDLRRMIMRMAVVLGICMGAAFLFRGEIASFVQAPLLAMDPTRADNLQSLGVADSMTISLKLAFYAGLVVAFPALLYFLAEFVLPALSTRERRVVLVAALVGFGLFLAGASFAFYGVLPATLEFFFRDAQAMQWRPTWTVGEYYSFTTQFVLAFGLAFELPVVVLALVKVGLLEYAQMKTTRPYAIVVIFLLAAVITPTPDIFTLLLMGAPMVLLYEACIWIARWMGRREEINPTGSGAARNDQTSDRGR
ncbi:MAG: twin-arginine translocase subunit TatC [Chthoniobacterales bacterium]|jgi:sec-independent protein translocase protein TatC|nr:twin-arginine translocase subunit TatC [Chthoniobacterales bacterium]